MIKKNFLFALIVVFATSIRIFPSEEEKNNSSANSFDLASVLKGVYEGSKLLIAYVRYFMTREKLSLDTQFIRAADELFDRYYSPVQFSTAASIGWAMQLFTLIVAGKPKATFEKYENELLPSIIGSNTKDKIKYYLDRIVEKMGARRGVYPQSKIDFKRSILQIIYDELSLKPLHPIEMKAIRDVLKDFEREWSKSLSLGNKPIAQEQKTITFADYIGVPEDARIFVDHLKNPELYKKFNISLPGGILLTGDPGTGKTYLARAIAGELDCPFFSYEGTKLTVKKYVGTGSMAIENALSSAKDAAKDAGKKMALIFIDEFDAIGSRASEFEGSASIATESINPLLAELDGFEDQEIKIIIIAATNYPDKIDPALIRPGRMGTIIHITSPDKTGRFSLLKTLLNKTFAVESIKIDSFIDKLADVTAGLTPAAIKEFIDDAGRIAIGRKKTEIGIDKDCIARTLWKIKQKDYENQLSKSSSRKEKLIRTLLELHKSKIPVTQLLASINDMTLSDIEEIFEKADKFAKNNPEKTIEEWLDIAITAQNHLIKIKKNQELIHLCEKIYDPIKIKDSEYPEKITSMSPGQRQALFALQAETIFKEFESAYLSANFAEFTAQIPRFNPQ